MVFALETYCAASDGESAARIEEEVVVTATGCRMITKFPAEELLVCGKTYVRGADLLERDESTCLRPKESLAMGRVQDRVVIVTGGAGGIGAAACRAIADGGRQGGGRRPRRGRGAGRRRRRSRRTAAPPTSVGVDVTDRAQVRAMIQHGVSTRTAS